MRLLLDTHVALWAIVDDPRFPPPPRDLIASQANTVMASAVNVWEITIKRALARGDMPVSATDAMRCFSEAGFECLAVSAEHAAAVEALPPLHADPFDRLLMAQSMAEPLRLRTRDARVARYSDTIIRV